MLICHRGSGSERPPFYFPHQLSSRLSRSSFHDALAWAGSLRRAAPFMPRPCHHALCPCMLESSSCSSFVVVSNSSHTTPPAQPFFSSFRFPSLNRQPNVKATNGPNNNNIYIQHIHISRHALSVSRFPPRHTPSHVQVVLSRSSSWL